MKESEATLGTLLKVAVIAKEAGISVAYCLNRYVTEQAEKSWDDLGMSLLMRRTKQKTLEEIIELEMPEFIKAVKDSDRVILSSEAFGDSELLLLGMAIRYAGNNGKKIVILEKEKDGKNETIDPILQSEH